MLQFPTLPKKKKKKKKKEISRYDSSIFNQAWLFLRVLCWVVTLVTYNETVPAQK
jgi:hypothetical protein